jgi:uncharacterized repeat protein (TIGR04076 family)
MLRVVDVTRDVAIVVREIRGYCSAGFQVGDRIIIRGANIVKDESGPICGYAFSNIYPSIFAVRCGVDFAHLGLPNRLWQCVDPGPPWTAGGTVYFEIVPLDQVADTV